MPDSMKASFSEYTIFPGKFLWGWGKMLFVVQKLAELQKI
jgi:hypothetical protein